MNGTELILDADADTSITADTDDTIHFKIAGDDFTMIELHLQLQKLLILKMMLNHS